MRDRVHSDTVGDRVHSDTARDRVHSDIVTDRVHRNTHAHTHTECTGTQ